MADTSPDRWHGMAVDYIFSAPVPLYAAIPPDLERVLEAWLTLSAEVRAQILELINHVQER